MVLRAWKAAQHYMQQKVDFLCLQEVKLTPEKANSFMCMAHKHKYYSMFVLSWGREKRMHRAEIFGQVESRCLCLFAIRPGWWQHGGAQKPSLYMSMCVMCSWFVFLCALNCRDPEKVWNHLHETIVSLRGRHWMMLGRLMRIL